MQNIKEALKKGMSEKEIRESFDAELASAQKEMETERKTEVQQEEKRKALIAAVLDYGKACGASEDTLDALNRTLQNELPKLEKVAFKNFNLAISDFTPKDWHHLFDWFYRW